MHRKSFLLLENCVGNQSATIFVILNRWTSDSTVGTKDTTIPFFWLKDFFAIVTFIKELTGRCWHFLFFFKPAIWASNC